MDITDSKKILRFFGYTNNFPRKNRQGIELWSTCVARRCSSRNRRDTAKDRKKVFKILKILEEAGYSASEKKSEYLLKETIWLGYVITEHRIKPSKEKTQAMLQLKSATSCKELKSFLRAIQYLAKFIPKLSEKPTE